jgi:hypothetical protein
MSCRTNCCKTFLFVFVLLAMAILAAPAFAQTATAQTCIQNEYNLSQGVSATGTTGSTKVNCTANDVSIAQVKNITDPVTGNPITTCFQGSTFNFVADFEVKTTSSQARENIGLYIATNSQTQALTGSCDDAIITAKESAQYHETDPLPDNCGDTQSSDSSPAFGAGTEDVKLEIDGFLCQAPAGSSTLVLPNCTSWQIPGGTIQCVSTDGSYPFNGPNGTPTAVPGTKSKCNCGLISLPITPVTATAIVQKACTTTKTPGPANFAQNPTSQSPTLCDAGPEGSTVTYTVSVTNTSTAGGVVIDQVCDSAYGSIYDDGTFSACKAGTSGITALNGNCPMGPLAAAGQAGATGTCTFSAKVGENLAGLNDIVTVAGHSSVNTTSQFTQGSNQVTVTSTDAPSAATVTKQFIATEAGCATARYEVDVKNTSSPDETLTLSALNDSPYGDLTKCTNALCANNSGGNGTFQILGTNCGLATAVGTLLSNPGVGGGAFGTITPTSTYTCQFDGQFCSALTSGCITNKDTVTATLAGDESEAVDTTGSKNSVNLQECFNATVLP